MKLSESLISRYRAIVTMDFGELFGLAPDGIQLPACNFMWSDTVFIETPTTIYHFAYSMFLDTLTGERKNIYFCIGTSVYICKWSLINALSFVDMAILLYLVFQKHETFNL